MEQEQLTVYLPSQSDEGIYNGVYYTTDVVNIINGLLCRNIMP